MPRHHLPTPEEADGAFTIDTFTTQRGRCVGGQQMKVAVAVTVRGRKHRLALHKC